MIKRCPDRSGGPELPDGEADRAHRRETLGALGTALALVLAMVGGKIKALVGRPSRLVDGEHGGGRGWKAPIKPQQD